MAPIRMLGATALAALVSAGTASAHAQMSPPLVKSGEAQVFTLAVPTEKENARTTGVELVPPPGFAIDSFAPTPGWKRQVSSSGSGESATVDRVTWTGGSIPHGEFAEFRFLASTSGARTYSFTVRQTYSDGSVVDWSGPESADAPAPTVEAVSSLGGGSSSTLAIVALVVAGIALVLGVSSLLGGRRELA
jgi:uncharacterized protein YcnI